MQQIIFLAIKYSKCVINNEREKHAIFIVTPPKYIFYQPYEVSCRKHGDGNECVQWCIDKCRQGDAVIYAKYEINKVLFFLRLMMKFWC